MLTAAQAAVRLGIAQRTVQKWCRELGLRKVGRDYVLTDEDVRRIAEHAQDGPGRPRGKA